MRKIRMGMVGGGPGAFIGAVHRMAAALDGHIELVAGAFSSKPEKSRQAGADLYLDPQRVYPSFREMIIQEATLPADQRIDFVTIVTPNHLHFEPAKLALEHGFHVVCDKPIAFSTAEAVILQQLVDKTGCLFALTHNYTGYPMVKQAKAMVADGQLGTIRKVVVEYPQGWLSTQLEASDQKQAAWRTDPSKSGKAGAMGDIGTHAENLATYISGLKLEEVSADLTAFVPGRALDDDGNVLLRFKGGAKGVLHASQISAGEENGLKIRIYGEKGGLFWQQLEPNTLEWMTLDQHRQLIRTGVGDLSAAAQHATRLPPGHPEGYLEAFANIYCAFAKAVQARLAETTPDPLDLDFPSVNEGVAGMQFIDAVVASSANNAAWTKLATSY